MKLLTNIRDLTEVVQILIILVVFNLFVSFHIQGFRCHIFVLMEPATLDFWVGTTGIGTRTFTSFLRGTSPLGHAQSKERGVAD